MEIKNFGHNYLKRLNYLTHHLDMNMIKEFTDEIISRNKTPNTIYFFGNGGSASTASHFSCDLGKGCKSEFFSVRTESPMDNLATMSAYSNDNGYDKAPHDYLTHKIKPHDMIVLISASGNSQNLVNIVGLAKLHHATLVGLLGFDGGKLKSHCDIPIVVKSEKGEYGVVEDTHMIINHMITNYIQQRFK